METRFGVRLTSAMLDSGHMKNTLCSSTSMDKDMCLYKRPNIVDEKLGSTDTGMKLISGTDCDNPLATEATCSRCRCRVLLPFKRQLCGTERGGQKKIRLQARIRHLRCQR